jgi:histidine triad (HIT) family protein
MPESVFAKIISHELAAKIRYEDDDFIAFDDIHPRAPVHVLIVSKISYATLEDVPSTDTEFHAKLLLAARKVAEKLQIQHNYKLHMNVGLNVQAVHHLHLHLLGGWDTPNPETAAGM